MCETKERAVASGRMRGPRKVAHCLPRGLAEARAPGERDRPGNRWATASRVEEAQGPGLRSSPRTTWPSQVEGPAGGGECVRRPALGRAFAWELGAGQGPEIRGDQQGREARTLPLSRPQPSGSQDLGRRPPSSTFKLSAFSLLRKRELLGEESKVATRRHLAQGRRGPAAEMGE